MKTNINKMRRRRNNLWGYGFTTPSAILLFVFIILPIFPEKSADLAVLLCCF